MLLTIAIILLILWALGLLRLPRRRRPDPPAAGHRHHRAHLELRRRPPRRFRRSLAVAGRVKRALNAADDEQHFDPRSPCSAPARPAYTAAIYAARAGLSPIVIQGIQPGGQLTTTTDVENYPGFRDVIQGPWLMEEMQAQAEHVGTKIVWDHITEVDLSRRPFRLIGDGGAHYFADALVIATGAQAKWLGLPSEEHMKGRGVSACATCDGFFYRGKKVAVIGGGNTAVEEALYLTNHSHDVTLIHRRDSLRAEKILQDRLFANPNIKVIWDSEVVEFVGGGDARGAGRARLSRTSAPAKSARLEVEGAFVAIGHSPATELFEGQLELDSDGYIEVEAGHDQDQRSGRVRLRRRDGQNLPPGGDRRRDRLHGRARCREISRRAGI